MNSLVYFSIIALLSHCFFSILFLTCIKKDAPKFLWLLFVVIPIPFIGTILGPISGFDNTIIRLLFSAASFFLIGPLLYFYCKSILCEVIPKKVLLLHCVPFLFFTFLLINFAPPPAPFGDTELVDVILKSSNKARLPKHILTACITLSNICYSILIIRLIQKSKLKIKEFYSTTNYSITLQWLYWLAIFFVLLSLISFLEKINPGGENFIPYTNQLGPLSNLLFVFFLSGFGFQQGILTELSTKKTEATQDVSDVILEPKKIIKKENNFDDLEVKLNQYMIMKKGFLNENLRLSDVAKEVNVSSNELSFFINQSYQKNFYKYVNGFRVDHACQLLKDTSYDKYTIVTIGYESGFNSKSTLIKFLKNKQIKHLHFTEKHPHKSYKCVRTYLFGLLGCVIILI